MKVGVIVFPGSNCDHDAWYAIEHNLGHQAEFIWHDSGTLENVDAVILPGGFSYGDYLRCGAIARFSPVMRAVRKFADDGGLVLGICNGFQILVESHLLPGALLRNGGLKFVAAKLPFAPKPPTVRSPTPAERPASSCYPWRTAKAVTSPTIARWTNWRPRTAWCSAISTIPTASLRDIAGILNKGRNVMGMMPHPERACDSLMGSTEGRAVFESMFAAVAAISR